MGALVAGLLVVLGLAGSAGAVEIVEGEVITEARGPGSDATTHIGAEDDQARVHGRVVRRIVIRGNVETRATGPRAHACTSIGAVGGCDAPSREKLESRRLERR